MVKVYLFLMFSRTFLINLLITFVYDLVTKKVWPTIHQVTQLIRHSDRLRCCSNPATRNNRQEAGNRNASKLPCASATASCAN